MQTGVPREAAGGERVDAGADRGHAEAFDALPTAVLVVDATGRIGFANREAVELLGLERHVLEGVALNTLLAPRDVLQELLARAFADAGVVRRVVRRATSSGEQVQLSLRRLADREAAVVTLHAELAFGEPGERSEAGEPSASSRSIDERAALATRARFVEAALDCAPAFIIAISAEGLIEYINRTLPQYSPEQCIGMYWLAFFTPEEAALGEQRFAEMYRTGRTVFYETSTAGADGEPRWFEAQLAPIRRGDEIIGGILVSQDVTERKRTHAELMSSRHMALLGTLAAGVAHEINTPIQFVGDSVRFLSEALADLLGLFDTLQRLRKALATGEQPAEVIFAAAAKAEEDVDLAYLRTSLPQAFERCIEGLNQIAKIVRSLRDFAHPMAEAKEPADLNRVVENALTIAKNEYKFVAMVEASLGEVPLITCNSAGLTQVVLNLVVNAAHAIGDVFHDTGAKGVIRVATWFERGAAIIAVSDTGTGIPEAIRPRIFDPFFTTKSVGKGTGQGLSIAWSIVNEQHSGELTFDTEIGKGTTFTVRIPAEPPPQ